MSSYQIDEDLQHLISELADIFGKIEREHGYKILLDNRKLILYPSERNDIVDYDQSNRYNANNSLNRNQLVFELSELYPDNYRDITGRQLNSHSPNSNELRAIYCCLKQIENTDSFEIENLIKNCWEQNKNIFLDNQCFSIFDWKDGMVNYCLTLDFTITCQLQIELRNINEIQINLPSYENILKQSIIEWFNNLTNWSLNQYSPNAPCPENDNNPNNQFIKDIKVLGLDEQTLRIKRNEEKGGLIIKLRIILRIVHNSNHLEG